MVPLNPENGMKQVFPQWLPEGGNEAIRNKTPEWLTMPLKETSNLTDGSIIYGFGKIATAIPGTLWIAIPAKKPKI